MDMRVYYASTGDTVTGFNIANLYANGRSGAFFDVISTGNTFTDLDGLSPSGVGQAVARWSDISGNGIHALQPVVSSRGVQLSDSIDISGAILGFEVAVPTGGWDGSLIMASETGILNMRVVIPAGNFYFGNNFFVGNRMFAIGFFDGVLSIPHNTTLRKRFEDAGAGKVFSGVTDFSSFFENYNFLKSFSYIDTSSATTLNRAWFGCDNLESIPLITTSNVTNWGQAFEGCTNLSYFPKLDVKKATNFNRTWANCSSLVNFDGNVFFGVTATSFIDSFMNTNLNQKSIDSILINIEKNKTSGGTFNRSGGAEPSALGNIAMNKLISRGWEISSAA